MRTTSGIKLGSKYLIPAPYVNSNYEYTKFGSYIIGGVLNVVLDGTIASETIAQEIQDIASLSANTDCLDLIIGCDGSADFLQGSGRITNVSVNASDSSPFTATYSITVSLEVVNGQPAVKPDTDFLQLFGLPANASFIKNYNEQITVEGDATVIGYYDSVLGISKSFIKASGSISITCSTQAICGIPSFSGLDQAISLLQARYNALSAFNFSQSGHPLSRYAGWARWLDSKSISIDEGGTVSCSFDIYLTQGQCLPIARIDIRTEDKLDHTLGTTTDILNRSINGTINGLSTATSDLLQDKTGTNERVNNAKAAYSAIVALVQSGAWPGDAPKLSDEEGLCIPPECSLAPQTLYYQRLSSNVNISKVSGEISFSAEFGPTSGCQLNNFDIDTTIEEEFPVTRFREFIIPNSPNPVIQYIGDTPHKATVTSQGSIKDCDKTKKPQLIACVRSAFNQAATPYNGWLKTSEQITESKFGYKIMATFIKVVCN